MNKLTDEQFDAIRKELYHRNFEPRDGIKDEFWDCLGNKILDCVMDGLRLYDAQIKNNAKS